MINAILTGFLKLILSFIGLILTPINNLITQHMPSLDNALSGLATIFNLIGNFIGWLFDAMCLYPTTIAFLVSALVFKLTFPLLVSVFKLIVKWYEKLKL